MHIRPQRVVFPHAWVGHIPFAMWLVAQHRPACVVELGVHSGNSFFAMCQSADELGFPCILHGIDTWEGEQHAGQYESSVWNDVSAYARTHYPDRATLHRCFFDDALNSFSDGSVDLLHIDGLHTLEAVKHDFETWLPKLSRRGIVLFHDIAEKREDFGVYILWDELKQRYPSLEFQHSHGLGVLFVGPQAQDTHALLSVGGQFSPLAYFELAGKVLMAELSASSAAQVGTQATLYFGQETPATFCESNSFKAGVALQGMTTLNWSLPACVTALRFDPSVGPSAIEIRRFELCSSQGESLWRLQGANDIEAVGDLFWLSRGLRSGVLLHLICTGIDPQFKLRLPAELLPLPAGTQLVVELQAHPVDSPMAMEAVQRSHDDQKQMQIQLETDCALLRQSQTVFQSQLDASQVHCTALQESITDLERRNARLELESQAVSHQLSQARQLRGFRLLRFLNPKTF